MTRRISEQIIALKIAMERVQINLEAIQCQLFTVSLEQSAQVQLEKLHLESALSGIQYSVMELHRALNVPERPDLTDYKF